MKTYTLLLDFLILCLLTLAIYFQVTDVAMTNAVPGPRGSIRTLIICWQTFFAVASFCIFLRYIARNVR